jgi:hypothetical protein
MKTMKKVFALSLMLMVSILHGEHVEFPEEHNNSKPRVAHVSR